MFEEKDFEQLYRLKTRLGFDKTSEFDVCTSYFFSFNSKMVFIKKARKFYLVMVSSNTGFEPIYRQLVFDCVYRDTDFNKTVNEFKYYCCRLME